jgi:hypothetical protein
MIQTVMKMPVENAENGPERSVKKSMFTAILGAILLRAIRYSL